MYRGGANDILGPGLHLLETDIDIGALRTVIAYLRYHFTNSVAYIDHDAGISLHNLKQKVDILNPTLEPFSGKDPMGIIEFLSTMMEDFNVQRLSKGIASLTIA